MSKCRFNTAIDVMGGTGTISYKLKQHGKNVCYNDRLRFNFHIGRAVVENNNVKLTTSDVRFLTQKHRGVEYDDFVERTFRGVFYTDKENNWIDTFIGNLKTFTSKYKTSLALASLFQSCIIKRPYNLFHRKNLYIRLADVRRSFGNKTTWDKSFEHWFDYFVREYNGCVFDSGNKTKAMNRDILDVPDDGYDVVYLDPPYTSQKNTVDYVEYYHFLEGLCMYLERGCESWKKAIDWNRKPLPINHPKSKWNDRSELHGAFEEVFKKFTPSMMAVSWNDIGYPHHDDLITLLKKYYGTVTMKSINYKYVLSPKQSRELLLFAR